MNKFNTHSNKYKCTTAMRNNTIRFGVIADTHLGSKYSDVSMLRKAYKYMEDLGIKIVLNAGDLTDGTPKMHRGFINELVVFNYEQNIDYVLDNYPKTIPTYFIAGNHDYTWYKDSGIDIVKDLCSRVKEWKYLGMSNGFLNIEGFKIQVVHPKGGGGSVYKSNKLQKRMHNMRAANVDIDLLIQGHYHTSSFLNYHNMHGMNAGAFQRQTPYLFEKDLHPDLGFSIISVKFVGGTYSVSYEWIPFSVLEEM